MNSISIIGTGFVGLVTGTCLSEFGLNVVCMDNDADRVRALGEGRAPLAEPGLPALIAKNVSSGRLRFSHDIAEAVASSRVIFLAVPTPSGGDGAADLRHVLEAAEAIGRHMTEPKVVVNKSTAPVGTARRIREVIQAGLQSRGLAVGFDVVSNPEFLREGAAVRDFMHPDRIVIGSESEAGREAIRDIYNVLYLIETPFIFTTLETAELIKYAANAFLATKIAFINEVAALCDMSGADVRDVARAMGMDGRIGRYFLHPSPGFGGSCLPKDVRALVKMGEGSGAPMTIADAVARANERQKLRMVERIVAGLGSPAGQTVAVLGLAFKQGTDDLRESSAVAIVRGLLESGVRLRVFDPLAMENARTGPLKGYPSDALTFAADEYDTALDADALAILTEWNQFRHLDLARLAQVMRGRRFFDFRNICEPDEVARFGFAYEGLGRPAKGRYRAAAPGVALGPPEGQ